MMVDLIDRQALMRDFCGFDLNECMKYGNITAEQLDNSYSSMMMYEISGEIQRAPTIDPENLRPQGEWVKSEDDYYGLNIIKCSLCREEWCFEVDDDVEALNYHYCPNCGAKMKGAENNA